MSDEDVLVSSSELRGENTDIFASVNLPAPTTEQQSIIEGALTGKNIKVQAFAGTGKTTSIKQLARVIKKPSLYIAFNRDIVADVSNDLPSHVKGKTAHSMAFLSIVAGNRQMEVKFQGRNELWYHANVSRFIGGKVDKKILAMIIRIVKNFIRSTDIEPVGIHISPADRAMLNQMSESNSEKIITELVRLAQENRHKTPSEISESVKTTYAKSHLDHKPIVKDYLSLQECQELIQKTINNAAKYSANDDISEDDFPSSLANKILAKDNEKQNGNLSSAALTDELLKRAFILWNNIADQETDCAIDYDAYLKLWQLSKPQLDAEVIYVDEAQDLDPVMLDVLKNQKSQMIWLGDTYQQIYAWRGAVNALKNVNNCLEFELTETFRFSPFIASFANIALKTLGESRTIKSNKVTTAGRIEKTAIISRTNRNLFDQALLLAQKGTSFSWSDNSFNPEALVRHCQELIKIETGQLPFMDIYKGFSSISELEIFLEEENNDTISRPLALCKRFNFNINEISRVLSLINKFVVSDSNLLLTTAHKSKGKEWDRVILGEDFCDSIDREKRSGKNTKHEWNLLYVALTRAKQDLTLVDSIKVLLGVLPALENSDNSR